MARRCESKRGKRSAAWLVVALLGFLGAGPSAAQNLGLVVRDDTLGSLRNEVVPSGMDSLGQHADYLIEPALGEQMGGNLFHSFSHFSVGVGEVATFTGPASVDNIVSRVTGGHLSDIDGTLRTTIDGAALFLLNPAGISFGEASHLDVQGSFHATTADVLRFEDGTDFDALGTLSKPLLSVAEPSAFGFTRPDPGLISVSRTQDLAVPAGETLSLIGGFDSRFPALGGVQIISTAGVGENIRAPGARVQIAAARPGIDVAVDLADLDIDALGAGALGNVVLQNSAWVDVSTPFGGDAPAGSVLIRGEHFVMQETAQILARNGADAEVGGAIEIATTEAIEIGGRSQITTWSQAGAASGGASLRSDRVIVSGNGRVNSFATGSGTGGSIELAAATVDLSGGGIVASEAFSVGAGGAIEIRAEKLTISNAENDPVGTFVSTNTLSTDGAAGNGGALSIEVGTLELSEGGQLFARTSGAGDAGALTVVAADLVHLSGVDGDGRPSGVTSRALETATGRGGRLAIETPVLEAENGAQISSDTFGAGAAGDLEIVAQERVTVVGGENGASVVSAASFERAASPPLLGPGGDLRIETGVLELRNGGQVSASTSGTGNAGGIEIEAGRVEISGAADPTGFNVSGVFSQSLTRGVADGGDGGDIAITAVGNIDVSEGGRISARSDGSGNAGEIRVTTGDSLTLTSGGQITTEAEFASGGKITVKASELVYLLDSVIATSVKVGDGGGGDIVIDPPIVALNRSELRADAFEGPGGNMSITADLFVVSADSVLSASSELNIDGVIAIDAPETDLSGELSNLPETFLDASALLGSPCAARTSRAGSFVVRGQGAVPAPPDSPFAPVDADGLAAAAAQPPATAACPAQEEAP